MPVAVPQKKAKRAEPKAVPQTTSEESEALEPFGAQIPFADPSWYQSVSVYQFHASRLRNENGSQLTRHVG